MNKLRMHSDFPVKTFSNVLDEIFNRSLGDFVGFDSTHTVPAVNIRETDEQYILEMAAPGFDKSDFNVQLDNNQLVLSAEKKTEDEKTEGKYARKEFHFEKFSRSFTLPETADINKIDAQYDKGVLHLHIAKKEEAKVQPAKTIEIK